MTIRPRVCAGSTEELTKVLQDIKQISGVSLTRTYVVLDNIKQNTAVIPRNHAALPQK